MQFRKDDLKRLWGPRGDSSGEDNGQVTIIGGSSLFQGAPLMSLIAASRLVDMVFLATPDEDKNIARKEALFSQIRSFIWVPGEDLDRYIAKSDAVLMGPGLMRFGQEGGSFDEVGEQTKRLTKDLLEKFPSKKWVIDGGSLQVMEAEWIPKNAILTPNKKEFEMLFNIQYSMFNVQSLAQKYKCVICYKAPVAVVSDGESTYEIAGGNAGLTKGGTGDVLAGIIVGLAAKNPPLLAAAAGTYLIKKTAEKLAQGVGLNFNADDVAENVFSTFQALLETREAESEEDGQGGNN